MRYIRESLVTDLVTHGMDPKLAETAKDTAYNYLQFWLDTSGPWSTYMGLFCMQAVCTYIHT